MFQRGMEKVMKLFYLIGEKIYYVLEKKKITLKKQPSYDMQNLYPGRNSEEKLKDYYIKKIAQVLCVLAAGIMFSLLSFVNEYRENIIIDEKYIARNGYGQGGLETEITADFEDGGREEITLTIGEQRFKEEELEKLYEKAIEQLSITLFSEGDCAEEVRNQINFPEQLEGFPFSIQWESSNYALVDYDGTVYNDNLAENGETVNLTAVFQYYDFKREYIFTVHILPSVLSKEEERRKLLTENLEENESKSIYEEHYVLPDRVGGKKVTWEDKKENNAILILLLTCMTAFVIYHMKDYELHKQVMQKQEEMFLCYPEVVNRLVLYVGAGMTVRNAWRKIALENKDKMRKNGRKGYIYQEMLFTCYEMDSGVAEGEAYERFGRRCGLQQYIKLATLLVQNMQKGNSTMLVQLKEEAETAFVERMNQARKKGEEAGTKLLMPMMLLLGIVMVLIMIPAFGTFGM